MFKQNQAYKQYDLFGVTRTLSLRQIKMWENSVEHTFFQNIFSQIDETSFRVLYSDKKSRPNVPINQLVGSLILKHLFNWTYERLFNNLNFNILTRHAIGIDILTDNIFSEASIFNFQNRVIDYFLATGKDLLTEVFDKVTTDQLKEFGIKTDIQRGDSFLMGSNIFDYSRLQLLVEVLLRLYRILEEDDAITYSKALQVYTKQTSGQYIYQLPKENIPKEINSLANIYHKLYTKIGGKYKETSAFTIFERVYYEHFVIKDNESVVVPSNELNSGILMSPDDEDATFRKKGRVKSKGYSGHISETANPENAFNLITDIEASPNNINDANILEARIPDMITKTPDLEEYHSDGAYGSPKVDELMDENKIKQVQTAISGRKAHAEIAIEEIADNEFKVSCEFGQKIMAEPTKAGRWRVVFDKNKCSGCPLSQACASNKYMGKTKRSNRIWYFTIEQVRLNKRMQNYEDIPEERRLLRANVEATIKEVKRGMKNGKLRVRSEIKARFYLAMTSMAVNLTRIHKYISAKKAKNLLNRISLQYFSLIPVKYNR